MSADSSWYLLGEGEAQDSWKERRVGRIKDFVEVDIEVADVRNLFA